MWESGRVKRVSRRVEKEHIGWRLRVGVRVRYVVWVHKVKSVSSVRIGLDF